MQTTEIYARLVKYKLNSDKLFFGSNLKAQILQALQKGVRSGFLLNKKMCVIGDWETNLLINT